MAEPPTITSRVVHCTTSSPAASEMTRWPEAAVLGVLLAAPAFLVGYLVAGFTVKKQALHDILASCLVLRRP